LYVASFTTPLADLVARLAVLRVGGLPAVGLFQAAIGLALALKTVIRASFAVYFMPAVNRRSDTKEKFGETVEFIQALSVITGIMAVPLVLFPELWLTLLYSRTFAQVSPYVWLFALAVVVQLFGAATQMLIAGLDHIGTFALAFVAGDLVTGALSWWLVPHIGIYGVGIAMLLNGLFMFAVGAWKIWSKHRLKIHEAVGSSTLLTLGAIAAGGTTANVLHSDSAPAIGARVLVGLVLVGLVFASAARRPPD